MSALIGKENQEAEAYMHEAMNVAKEATCQRSKCGAVIVQGNIIIGKGYNSPPAEKENQRRCTYDKKNYHAKITDKTCCIHAEQRAIMDALTKNAHALKGATLYFARLDHDNTMLKAGNPYCTICSKCALDVGIQTFVLWHEEGIRAYDTEEYNHLSFNYTE